MPQSAPAAAVRSAAWPAGAVSAFEPKIDPDRSTIRVGEHDGVPGPVRPASRTAVRRIRGPRQRIARARRRHPLPAREAQSPAANRLQHGRQIAPARAVVEDGLEGGDGPFQFGQFLQDLIFPGHL